MFTLPQVRSKSAPFDEHKHPRDDHGQWTTASGKQFVFKPGHARHKKVAEHVRRALERLVAARVHLPDMVQVDKLSSHNVHGWHDTNDVSIGSRVTINPNSWFWKDPEANAKTLHEKGVLSTDDPTHVVTHEIGHSLHKRQYPNSSYDQIMTNYRFEGAEQKAMVEKEVSKYATTNGHEFVAEVFAGLVAGKTYSPFIMRVYQHLHGPSVPTEQEKSFRLPQVREKLGAFDPGKHPRGNPKNRGQFSSHGGAHASGFGLPQARKPSPPALPARHNPLLESLFAEPVQQKPSASTASLRTNPLLEQVFGEGAPKPPLEHDPNYKPDKPLRPPGTGKPPANLGQPKSVDEARDQLIWLLGRSSIIREQGRAAGRQSPKLARELTFNINLASRLRHQFFRGSQAAQTAQDKKEEAASAKS